MSHENRILDEIASGEGETVEFKIRLPDDRTLERLLTAFANAQGGTLLVGIDDARNVVGLTESELPAQYERLKRVAATVLPWPIEVGVLSIQGRSIIYAFLQPAPAHLRPIYTSSGEVLVRDRDIVRSVERPTPPPPNLKRHTQPPLILFVAMSFRDSEEPALVDYYHSMERAARASSFPVELRRIDLIEGDYEISQRIMDEIDRADAVLADFTLSPRNVYFELGFARGRGKRIIQTARQDTLLEFDVRNWRTLFYKNATELEAKLVPALGELYQEDHGHGRNH